VKEGFEPKKFGLNEPKLQASYSKNPIVLRAMHKVRTWVIKTKEYPEIPILTKKR